MFENTESCVDCWHAISRFVESWTGVAFELNPESGSINDYEARVDVKLPISIRYWIDFSEKSELISEYFSYRDALEIEWLTDFDSLSILLQGERDFYWAVKREDLTQDDPPVTGYCLDYDSVDEQFVEQGEWASSVSSFALDYLLTYLYSPDGSFSARFADAEVTLSQLEQELGNSTRFGDLLLLSQGEMLIALNSNESNWNYGRINCYFREYIAPADLSPLLQKIYENATIIGGQYALRRNSTDQE
ncbi:hypothetical protein [Gimesia chilikensis]|uniref:hypothetical protein n=1 Tax=Gimesia chilikensis TaxID=2605989 RepID=UPI003A937BE0